MDEANKIKEEKTEIRLTTATLAGVGARPEVRAVAASSVGVGSASSSGAATAPAIDEQAAPLFSPEEAKDFRACPYQKSRLSRESLLRHGDKQFKPSYACNVP